MKCPHCPASRTRGLHCNHCLRHVFLVQSPSGEQFLVDHRGDRWCKAR